MSDKYHSRLYYIEKCWKFISIGQERQFLDYDDDVANFTFLADILFVFKFSFMLIDPENSIEHIEKSYLFYARKRIFNI